MTDYAFAAAWLADNLAAARILVNSSSCISCTSMGRETCAACWLEEAFDRYTPAEPEPEKDGAE